MAGVALGGENLRRFSPLVCGVQESSSHVRDGQFLSIQPAKKLVLEFGNVHRKVTRPTVGVIGFFGQSNICRMISVAILP